MRYLNIVFSLVCLLWVSPADAQNPNPQQIADTMVRLCVGGGRTEATSGTASGGADLSLRSLDLKGNVKGEFKVNKSSAEGLINGLDNALSQVAADQADKVRVCLQPVRERLLDVMLPPRQGSAGQTVTAPGGVAVGGNANGPITINPDPNKRTCRDPSHGVERYARTLAVTRESPEMGGGHNQGEWCNTLIGTLRGEFPGSAFTRVTSSEHTNNHCSPFNCPQYVYSCTVQVQADPVYVEKASQACR
jgi:hypothetical protein